MMQLATPEQFNMAEQPDGHGALPCVGLRTVFCMCRDKYSTTMKLAGHQFQYIIILYLSIQTYGQTCEATQTHIRAGSHMYMFHM